VEDVLGNLNALNDDIKFAVRNISAATPITPCSGRSWVQTVASPKARCWPRSTAISAAWKQFQTDFNAAGGRQFGSGWVFVTVSKDGKLAIETRPNQDTPIMDGKRALMGNDVWEHAYYLNYQNRRADYLKAWWGIP